MVTNDLHVEITSTALESFHLDVIVSGSIGAVESVRFIRSLRRLGAEVYPWLSKGASLFITPTALSWAAAREVTQEFEGKASHIALRDACIVAPASANIISEVAQGITNSPCTALIASYLGQKKPVFFIPNMHDSLLTSPFIAENMSRLKSLAYILNARKDEGKQKFPDPATLADEISHRMRLKPQNANILITMGTTRGYIDSVRYISNYSSGALGSQITEEFHRQGFLVKVIAGPSLVQPRTYSELIVTETHDEMSDAVKTCDNQPLDGAIFAASVLDFIPETRQLRKIRSSEDLAVKFIKTKKIIAMIQQNLKFKVGFKLESELNEKSELIAKNYLEGYQLSHLIMNQQSEVTQTLHKARAYIADSQVPEMLASKASIAKYLLKEAEKSLGFRR